MGGCCCPVSHMHLDEQEPNMIDSKLLLSSEQQAAALKHEGN